MKRDVKAFQNIVWEYYSSHGRHDLPWRLPEQDGVFDAYKILVSEIMLQQTQVARVIPKFNAFLLEFPNVTALAHAPLGKVLTAWSGLGYNRRAKFLWQAAQKVVQEHGGIFPTTQTELQTLPGVGSNTAGAIMAYAYNEATPFIETNIRSVFIHHFFTQESQVKDSDILELVVASLPKDDRVRQWYWALMDYGTYLKQTAGNAARAGKMYVHQSIFHGSRRQLRGQVIRALVDGPQTRTQLAHTITDLRLGEVLQTLTNEGLIVHTKFGYELPA